MKTNIKLIIGIFTIAVLMSACGSSSTGETEEHGEHGEHEEGHGEEGVVSLTEQQMDAIGLKIVSIENRNLTSGIQASGKLKLAPQDKADISPVLGGIIKELRVFEGDKVKKGQILATLEHPDFIQLQQDYINTINNLEYLEKEYERQKKLYEEKVGSGKDFQKITAEYNNSKSTVQGLKIKLRMIGLNESEVAKGKVFSTIPITAPLSGTISLVETNIGAFVEPLSKVFEIVNNDKIHADLMVYEKDISKIKIGQKIYFTTSSLMGQELEGEIYAISPAFKNDPKAIHVHANIATKNIDLISGMYIQGRIVAENIMTSVLPEQAIVTEDEKTYIFVKKRGEAHDHGHEKEEVTTKEHDHDEHAEEEAIDNDEDHGHAEHEEGKWEFEMVEVITGIASNGYIEIKLLKPLPKGAEIAGNGAYYLLAEMGKGETEHSH